MFLSSLFPSCAVLVVICPAALLMAEDSPAKTPHGSPSTQPAAAATAPKPFFKEKDLPGKYYFGDGLGVNCSLVLEADHRFSFKWHGCMGEYDSNVGSWSLEGDVLVVKPEKPNKHEGFEGMNVRYVPVRWGTRLYLVDENEMPCFCAVAATPGNTLGSDVRGEHYVKWSGETLPPAEGRPAIPERYREFYERGPVQAVVARVERDGKVILNKGTADRVKPSMLLAAKGPPTIELKVLSAQEHESVAQASYFWNSNRRVAAGDCFTTGGDLAGPWGTGFERFPNPPEGKKTRK